MPFALFLFLMFFIACAGPKYTLTPYKKPIPRVYDIKPLKIVDVNHIMRDLNPSDNLLDQSRDYLAPMTVPEPDLRAQFFEGTFNLDIIYFDDNSYNIREKDLPSLKKNAAWLISKPDYSILIAGYSGSNRTKEYNIALGQQRASSVRAYLSFLGVSPERIATISYGDEELLSDSFRSSDYAKQNRAEILLFKAAENDLD